MKRVGIAIHILMLFGSMKYIEYNAESSISTEKFESKSDVGYLIDCVDITTECEGPYFYSHIPLHEDQILLDESIDIVAADELINETIDCFVKEADLEEISDLIEIGCNDQRINVTIEKCKKLFVLNRMIAASSEEVLPACIQDSISCSIDAVSDEPHDLIIERLENLKERSSLGECCLQRLLYILDQERIVVRHLLHGRRGYVLELALDRRNEALALAGPTVEGLYQDILNYATNHSSTESDLECFVQENGYEKLWHALKKNDKKCFLMHLLRILSNYHVEIEHIQLEHSG